jgi:hypothetical protein
MAELLKQEIRLATNHVVGDLADFLWGGLMTHFGSAKNQNDLRVLSFQKLNDFQGLTGVPDIDTKTDDPRAMLNEVIDDFLRWFVDGVFADASTRLIGA